MCETRQTVGMSFFGENETENTSKHKQRSEAYWIGFHERPSDPRTVSSNRNNERQLFLLYQNDFLSSFARLARALKMEKIAFYLILEYVLSLCCRHLCMLNFDSWYLMSNAPNHSWQWNKKATIENGFAQQRINICFFNRELCHRSENSFLVAAAAAHRHKCFTLFELVLRMASRHTIKSCQFINSMPLSLSSTCLSKDKVTATNDKKETETKWNRQSAEWNRTNT